MGVVIEREEWALTPLAYPFLAAVLLLPCFSPSHTTSASASSSSASPFDVGTTPFLRFRRAFLFLFSLASVVEGIQSVFGEDEFARCGLGREQMASRLAAFAAATLFLSGVSGVISDKLGPWMACIFYWILQLAVGAMKSFTLLSIIGTLYIKNSIKYQSACICDRELPKVIFCPCPQRLTEGMLNCHQFTPVSLPQNAWKCLLSMVLWSHSSFPE